MLRVDPLLILTLVCIATIALLMTIALTPKWLPEL